MEAIASGISGALINSKIYMLRASEEPKRSYTGEELSRGEEGFVVFGKITRYWRDTLSVQGSCKCKGRS
jgi:hypothetical protein